MQFPHCVSLVLLLLLNTPVALHVARPGVERLPPKAWHQDLMFLSQQLVKRHANAFHFISPRAFYSEVNELDARLVTLNPDEVFAGMDQIANSIGDGHTYIRIPNDAPLFPVEFQRFGNDYRLTAAAPAENVSDALGERLIAINTVPIDRVRTQLLALTPADETLALRDVRATLLLNNGMILHGLGITSDRNNVIYTFENSAGDQRTLNATSGSTVPISDWLRVQRTVPLYRQHPGEPLWCVFLKTTNAVYCSFQSYKSLPALSRTVFDLINNNHAEYLVVDLRLNKGGDYLLGLKYLVNPIRKISAINRTGHLFVLIGPRTFSAAMSNAAHFRAGTHATLVGEPIGEKPNSYQEAREMTLPHSRWIVRYSVKFYKFAKGSENLIRPDEEITETWDHYINGRDPVLDAVLRDCEVSK
jgi:hypothetical protein